MLFAYSFYHGSSVCKKAIRLPDFHHFKKPVLPPNPSKAYSDTRPGPYEVVFRVGYVAVVALRITTHLAKGWCQLGL